MHEVTMVCLSNHAFRDELAEVVHDGAQQIIQQAVEVSVLP